MTREDRRWQYLGAFAQELHFTPRDVDLLTVEEIDYFIDYLDRLRKENDRQAQQMKGAG